MSEQLILKLIEVLGPLFIQLYKDHQAQTGTDPTLADLVARLNSNAALYLGEGAAWKAAHPNV